MVEDTDVITIRVPKSLKNKLEERSKKNGIPMNLTVNKILQKEVLWDDHLAEMRWVNFDPTTIRDIFSHLTESQIKDVAKKTKHVVVSAIKFIYENPNLENTIDFIQSWLKDANMSFRYVKDENIHKFVVSHDMGMNWSVFAITTTDEFISELGFKQIHASADVKGYRFEISER